MNSEGDDLSWSSSGRRRDRPDITSFSFFLLPPHLRIFILWRIPTIKRASKSAHSARNWKDSPSCRASTRCRIYRPKGIRIAMERTTPGVPFVSTRFSTAARYISVILRKDIFFPKVLFFKIVILNYK